MLCPYHFQCLKNLFCLYLAHWVSTTILHQREGFLCFRKKTELSRFLVLPEFSSAQRPTFFKMGWRGQVERWRGGEESGWTIEFVDINISQWYSLSQSSNVNMQKHPTGLPHVPGFSRLQSLLPNDVAFLGISTRLVSAIWSFYADSKSSPVALFHSTDFPGPLAQSAEAENQVSSLKYTDIPKNVFPNLFSHFFSVCYVGCRGWTR